MKLLKWLDKHLEEILTFPLLVLMTCVMFLQVIMRYVFNDSQTWTEEFCRFAFIWMCFIGMSWCIRNGDMLRIDILETFIPKLGMPLAYLANIATLIFCIFLVKPGIDCFSAAIESNQLSAAMHIPMQFIYCSFVISVFLSIFRVIQKLFLMVTGRDNKTYE